MSQRGLGRGDAIIELGGLEERRPKTKDLVGQGIRGGGRSCESKIYNDQKKKNHWESQLTNFLEKFHHHPPAFYLFKTDPPTVYLHNGHWLMVSSSPIFSPFLEW